MSCSNNKLMQNIMNKEQVQIKREGEEKRDEREENIEKIGEEKY